MEEHGNPYVPSQLRKLLRRVELKNTPKSTEDHHDPFGSPKPVPPALLDLWKTMLLSILLVGIVFVIAYVVDVLIGLPWS